MSADSASAASGVGRVYAEALFSLAKESNSVDDTLEELREVLGVFRNNAEFEAVFLSPKIAHEDAERMIRETFTNRAGKRTVNLLLLLLRKRRQHALAAIVEGFEAMVDEDRNQSRVTVTSAAPLEELHEQRLAETLAKQTGQRILLETRVEPDLLGGALLRIGDTVIDGSLRTGLTRLARQLQDGTNEKGV